MVREECWKGSGFCWRQRGEGGGGGGGGGGGVIRHSV